MMDRQVAALAAHRATEPGDDLATWHERHLHPCLDRVTHRYTITDCEDRHDAALPNRPTDTALLAAAAASAKATPGASGGKP